MAKVLLKEINNDTVEPGGSMYAQTVYNAGLKFPKFTTITVSVSIQGELKSPPIVLSEYETEDVYCIEETVYNTIDVHGAGSVVWTRMDARDELLDHEPGLLYDATGSYVGPDEANEAEFGMGFACFHDDSYEETGPSVTIPDIHSAYTLHGVASEGISDAFKVPISVDTVFYSGMRVAGYPTFSCAPEVSYDTDEWHITCRGNVSFYKDSAGNEIGILRDRQHVSAGGFPIFRSLAVSYPVVPLYISYAAYPAMSWDSWNLNDCIKNTTFGSGATFSGTVTGSISSASLAAGWEIVTPLKIDWTLTIS